MDRITFYTTRHDEYTNKINEYLNGTIFKRAPFDIIVNEDFYEVKALNWFAKQKNSKFAHMYLSSEELKFLRLLKAKYHLIIVVIFDTHEEFYQVNYNILENWLKNLNHLTPGLGGQLSKMIQLSKKRLSTLSRLEI